MKKQTTVERLMFYLFLIMLSLFFLCSCTHRSHINHSGKYVESEVVNKQPGNCIVKINGIDGKYLFLSDSLKVGDTVYINVLKYRSKKVNVKKL